MGIAPDIIVLRARRALEATTSSDKISMFCNVQAPTASLRT